MIVQESVFRDILRLFVWFPLRWFILLLPISWGIALLRTMGDVHYSFSRGKKELLRDNISRLKGGSAAGDKKIAFGDDFSCPPASLCEAKRGGLYRKVFYTFLYCEKSVREYFRNHYIDHLFILIFPKFGIREIERFIEIEGLEFLDKALEKGRGVLLIHGHFGPVHLPLVVLARLGYRMKQIGFPTDEGLSWIGRNVAFRLRMKYEDKIPADIIKADSFLRPAFKWLNENGIIMITGDGTGTERKMGKHKVFNFFGQPVMLPLGPAILGVKTSAEILTIAILPGEKKPYKIIIGKSITTDYRGDDGIEDITQQFIKRLEGYINRYPGYMHFLDRFCPGGIIEGTG